MSELIVAVDGGGTKTDAVALTREGRIVARRRSAGSSPHFEGLARSVEIVDALVRDVAGGAPIRHVDLYLSGLDLPIEIERYSDAVGSMAWAQRGLVIENDLFAVLRSGTDEPDAVAVVCGSGVNAVGVRADGATVRFPSLGHLSGDWGGGSGLGPEALWHAARDIDGRGERTTLTSAICVELGVGTVAELIEQLHFGERDDADLYSLAPVIFAEAAAGDAVARGLVERQADELVAFVRAIVSRLELADHEFPVVLGGSILQGGHALLDDRVVAGVAAIAPRARIVMPDAPPILGAAIAAGLHAGLPHEAIVQLRAEMSARPEAAPV
jgi:N-acetylglucosamine kinase-like BadF-type ATPase